MFPLKELAGLVGAVLAGERREGLTLPPEVERAAAHSLIALRRTRARVQLQRTRAAGFEIPYLEGGSEHIGNDVVCIHGFSDSKDSFVDAARSLVRTHHVVLPDLPGFAEASQPWAFRYSLAAMTEVLGASLAAIGLERFHLVGNSLGGAVALAYALDNPERVRTLSLIGAAGVTMPVPSPLQLRVDAGDNPFAITTYGEWEAFLAEVFERPPFIPGFVRQVMARERMARAEINQKILDDLLRDDVDLTGRLSEVVPPTLVLWGDSDRFIDLSAARVYHAGIRDARLVILHGIGHCPQVEAPARTAHILRGHFAAV